MSRCEIYKLCSSLFLFVTAAVSALVTTQYEQASVVETEWEAATFTTEVTSDLIHCSSLCQASRCYEFMFDKDRICTMVDKWLANAVDQPSVKVFRLSRGEDEENVIFSAFYQVF